MLSTIHDTHQFIYFMYLFYQDESKFERITESIKYIKSYQEHKIEFLDEF